jgi:coproporphyrinogen III oxidase-like Fe-S oxidoreductase
MKSIYLLTFIGAMITGIAYFGRNAQTMRKLKRNLFVGGTFSRLLAKQFLRKLGFAR